MNIQRSHRNVIATSSAPYGEALMARRDAIDHSEVTVPIDQTCRWWWPFTLLMRMRDVAMAAFAKWNFSSVTVPVL